MFKWTEVKTWAKENNFNISKTPKLEQYHWEGKTYENLNELVIDLWNLKTNNKYLVYQKEYPKAQQ
jgi:hypothetical protein